MRSNINTSFFITWLFHPQSRAVPSSSQLGMDSKTLLDRALFSSHNSNEDRAETMSKSQKPSSFVSRARVQKSKLGKSLIENAIYEPDEEIWEKMEELLIERQKRIAERTAAGGYASAVSKKTQSESKIAKNSIRPDKKTNLSTARATERVSANELRAT